MLRYLISFQMGVIYRKWLKLSISGVASSFIDKKRPLFDVLNRSYDDGEREAISRGKIVPTAVSLQSRITDRKYNL